MKILYLHGHGSQPGGIKPMFLFRHGHDVINPALPAEDFQESVRVAQQAFDQGHPDVVVGSSRGGAVALSLNIGKVPLVLIAPAWKHSESTGTVKKAVTILHSANDKVVPLEDSRELLRNSGLPEEHLVVVGENHNMVDERALAALLKAVERANHGDN